jgi:hypothetical protein
MSIQYMNWEDKARAEFAKLFERQDDAEEGEILAVIPAKPAFERRQFRVSTAVPPKFRRKRRGWLYREIRNGSQEKRRAR